MIIGLFNQINSFRAQHGVASLSMDPLGTKDAEIRATQFSAYMATHLPNSPGFDPHQGYDTTAASLGYQIIGENLAFVTPDPNYIVYVVWQDSLHLAALLATGANVAGVSCVYSNGWPYWTYEPGCSANFCGHSSLPPPTSPPTPNPTPTLDSEESAFLTLINNYRSQNGLGPLQVSATLQAASQWMSNDMASKNYFSHIDSFGRSTDARLQAFGYTYAPWGENLAAGYSDAASNLAAWQSACDPDASGTCAYAHRRNMLNSAFVAIGIGRAYSGNSMYGWYWTTDFGGYLDKPISPNPNPAPTIVGFAANPPKIASGQSTMLSWSISGAIVSVTLDNGIGDVSGITSKAVSPTQTTTYTLTATNGGGTATAHATVTVTSMDNQPPTPPVLNSASAKNSNEVDLTWSASSDNVGVTGYEIFRNSLPVASVSGTSLSWADTSVSANTTYNYAVEAFDAVGNHSLLGNSITVTTPASLRSGGAPLISFFTANPSTVSAGEAATLSWSVSGATTITIDNGVGNVSNLTLKSVAPIQSTTYTLTATNSWGSATAVAGVHVNGSGGLTPSTPTLLSVLARSSSEVDLAWTGSTDKAGVTRYQILRNGSVIATLGVSYIAWSDTTVSSNTTYIYDIRAYDSAGNYSNPSNSIQVTTPGTPQRPPR